ncbi:MAG: SDR family NAD(P)-dependent oxidoreductase [Euryarchaeota archaeon]|jgi:UDP-glucose 4-epimerase|nr:SDR family NAD(P)-dependent oxidoreductase [Euryarchaeota archaeon]MBT4924868.1 SDR family NAD(P)-dependent oxidoreductase [Euryarchaeota archaeon]MBT5735669.1 SDR family NAD(P)-dependent oxidoreductase [Euryarchaeota archaeon]MBT7460864.1 SDR family NAD(P)-dependent oxidoreductase [Euryarchaeota archaeon]
MSELRILVTGGAGFLGSSLCHSLIEKGHKVVALDSLFRGTKDNLSEVLDDDNFTFIHDDVREVEALDSAVEVLGGLDLVFHLAAVNGTKWFHEAAHSVIDVNINGTLRTLELAMAHDARYVLASSPEAFGEAPEQPIRDGNMMQFTDPAKHQRHSYGASKYLDEVACQHAAREGLDVRIIRPFNAYGPRLVGDDYGQVVSIFFHKIINDETLVVHGNGSQTRSFTWIDDVTDGFVRAGLMDKGTDGSNLSGMAFNIGSTEEVTISQLAKEVVTTSGKDNSVIEFGTGYFGDSKRRLPDIESSKQALGWQPTVDLQQGLQKMWKELTEN